MKKSKAIIVLLLILSFMLVSISELRIVKAEPKTIVVPDDYPTIQGAIDAASEGDTIYVKKGRTYNETILIDKPLSLIGEDSRTTKLIGWAHIQPYTPGWLHPVIQIEADDIKISGFTVTYDHLASLEVEIGSK